MSVSFTLNDNHLLITGALDRFALGHPSCYKFPAITGPTILDLCKVESTDTAGLAWLLKLISHYQSHQTVSIINAPQQLLALASISNVLELLPLKNDNCS